MGDTYRRLRLAAVQAAPVWLNREATVQKACELIREAGSNRVDVIGFPESFIPGHPSWYYFHPATSKKSMEMAVALFKNSVEVPGAETDRLCQAAAEANALVVMGLNEKRPHATGTLCNTQLFIDRRGRIIGKHQKLVPTVGERLVHTGGSRDTQSVVMTEFGPVSGLCCGENWNPFALAVLTAQYTRIHVANWPNNLVPGYANLCHMSQLASRNIAFMCKCFVISSCGINSTEMIGALPSTEADRGFLRDQSKTGGSAVINPRGEVIAGPLEGNQEGILYAEADLEETLQGRIVQDFGGHYNRADVFRLSVNTGPTTLLEGPGGPPLAMGGGEFLSGEASGPPAASE